MKNKKRLIDANAIKYYDHATCYGAGIYRNNPIAYKDDIDEMPTVDAVPVVRCEDCKHYRTSGCAMDTYAFDVVEEGFCSYGERREGE